jgi:hypothetical protein
MPQGGSLPRRLRRGAPQRSKFELDFRTESSATADRGAWRHLHAGSVEQGREAHEAELDGAAPGRHVILLRRRGLMGRGRAKNRRSEPRKGFGWGPRARQKNRCAQSEREHPSEHERHQSKPRADGTVVA